MLSTKRFCDLRRPKTKTQKCHNYRTAFSRGIDLSSTMEGAGGIGGLLARSEAGGSGWTNHAYYFADGNGNITYMIDGSQSMVASYRYDPFGNITSQTGVMADANVYRFSSKEIMTGYGMYYYGYRFYAPQLQRWMNTDPADELGFDLLRPEQRVPPNYGGAYAFAQGTPALNEFCFVDNSPMGRVDAFGLIGWPTVGYGGPSSGLRIFWCTVGPKPGGPPKNRLPCHPLDFIECANTAKSMMDAGMVADDWRIFHTGCSLLAICFNDYW